MPQISQLAETFSSQIVWLLVFFAITYFIVGRGMVPRVMDTMDSRAKQITDDIAAAQDDAALARLVADYIAGMTDRFALQQHARLLGVDILQDAT